MGFSVMLWGAEKLVPAENWCPYGRFIPTPLVEQDCKRYGLCVLLVPTYYWYNFEKLLLSARENLNVPTNPMRQLTPLSPTQYSIKHRNNV